MALIRLESGGCIVADSKGISFNVSLCNTTKSDIAFLCRSKRCSLLPMATDKLNSAFALIGFVRL